MHVKSRNIHVTCITFRVGYLQIMLISSVPKLSNGMKRGRPRSKPALAVLSIDKIMSKRQIRWTDKAMRAAMDLVNDINKNT